MGEAFISDTNYKFPACAQMPGGDPCMPSLQVLTPEDYILPEGWVLAHSNREKRFYFFNKRDKTTQWHLPEGSRQKEPS